MARTLKPPINRIGGKHFLASWIAEKMPGHTLYCEVFSGAGHLLFGKKPGQIEVLNDVDNYLIGFFQVIKDHEKRQKLIETLRYMPYSRKLWQDLRHQWKTGNIPGDPIEQATQWLYLNRTTFAGDQRRGGFAVPSVTGRNPAQSFRASVDSFEGVAERLRNVTIECLDYRECVRRYDSEDSLFYIDPPYLSSGHYYNDSFTQDDHSGLTGLLHGVKGKVMVTHYQNDLYDELYRDWQRYEYQSFKGSHKSDGEEKPKTTEVLYCNFRPEVRTRNLFEGV
ncbi:MAG: DNA adenine methylase [wastewater metagenome]|nr:DNA adenine methylase [Candidatus Loosdrechtia aerotolerans]